jgi:site-specific DNA recombinase
MRVFGYCRVSTSGQAIDGVSLDAQRAKIAAWCSVNDAELVDVFVDAGLSGGKAHNRPALQAALDAACSAGGVLVVYSLSRLARSTRDTITIADRLEKAGAELVSLSERIDTTTAAGKMVFRMLAVLAEFERDQISERTTTAMQHMRAVWKFTGEVPFGFTLAADGETLVADDNESRIIELIRQLRTTGMSLRAIAAELDAQGVAPKKAGTWNAMTIRNILNRPA